MTFVPVAGLTVKLLRLQFYFSRKSHFLSMQLLLCLLADHMLMLTTVTKAIIEENFVLSIRMHQEVSMVTLTQQP